MLAAALCLSSSLVAFGPGPPPAETATTPPPVTPSPAPTTTPTTTTAEPALVPISDDAADAPLAATGAEWSLGAGIGQAGANVGIERKLGPALWLVLDVAATTATSNLTRPDPENEGETIETKRDSLSLSAAVDVGVRYYFVEDAPVKPSIHVTGGPFASLTTTNSEQTTFINDDTDSTDIEQSDQSLGLAATFGGAVDVPFFDNRLSVRVATDLARLSAALRHSEFDAGEAQKTDVTDLSANIFVAPSIEIRVYF
ncbi:MAG: hypothetical protein Q8O67_17565 [Deltaproteobacteria bacterium]|nr:hypothetical protein [Deltaproteobacteria bacterium]